MGLCPHSASPPFKRRRAKSSNIISSSLQQDWQRVYLLMSIFLVWYIWWLWMTYVSSWIRLSTGTSTSPWWFCDEFPTGGSSSSGFGCINTKGSSADKSLQWTINNLFILPRTYCKIKTRPYPPSGPKQSLTFTLYWTIIPKFSRIEPSVIL